MTRPYLNVRMPGFARMSMSLLNAVNTNAARRTEAVNQARAAMPAPPPGVELMPTGGGGQMHTGGVVTNWNEELPDPSAGGSEVTVGITNTYNQTPKRNTGVYAPRTGQQKGLKPGDPGYSYDSFDPQQVANHYALIAEQEAAKQKISPTTGMPLTEEERRYGAGYYIDPNNLQVKEAAAPGRVTYGITGKDKTWLDPTTGKWLEAPNGFYYEGGLIKPLDEAQVYYGMEGGWSGYAPAKLGATVALNKDAMALIQTLPTDRMAAGQGVENLGIQEWGATGGQGTAGWKVYTASQYEAPNVDPSRVLVFDPGANKYRQLGQGERVGPGMQFAYYEGDKMTGGQPMEQFNSQDYFQVKLSAPNASGYARVQQGGLARSQDGGGTVDLTGDGNEVKGPDGNYYRFNPQLQQFVPIPWTPTVISNVYDFRTLVPPEAQQKIMAGQPTNYYVTANVAMNSWGMGSPSDEYNPNAEYDPYAKAGVGRAPAWMMPYTYQLGELNPDGTVNMGAKNYYNESGPFKGQATGYFTTNEPKWTLRDPSLLTPDQQYQEYRNFLAIGPDEYAKVNGGAAADYFMPMYMQEMAEQNRPRPQTSPNADYGSEMPVDTGGGGGGDEGPPYEGDGEGGGDSSYGGGDGGVPVDTVGGGGGGGGGYPPMPGDGGTVGGGGGGGYGGGGSSGGGSGGGGGTGGTGSGNNWGVSTYDPETIMNVPSMKFLRGEIGFAEWATFAAQPTSIPALGVTIPAPNSLDWTKLERIRTMDPATWKNLVALWRSGNRDLESEMATLETFVPRGRTFESSLIQTVG